MGRKKMDSTRRGFLKTAGAAAGAAFMPKSLWAQSPGVEGARSGRAGRLPENQSAIHDDARSGVGMERLQEPGRPHLRRRRGLEALHRLSPLEDAGVWCRRSRLRRHPLRPLHRRRLARPPHAHLRLRRGGGEAGHRRYARSGRRVVRHDVGLDAARRASRRGCCITIPRIRRRTIRSRERFWCSRRRHNRRRPTATRFSTTTR